MTPKDHSSEGEIDSARDRESTPLVRFRFLREPLVHFFAIAAVFLLLTHLIGNEDDPSETIIITNGQIQQLQLVFERNWRRPATEQELKGLIDEHVKDEIYYREAKRIGLDTDDSVVRRRMRQKMEFLDEAPADLLQPTEQELQDFFQKHSANYAKDPMFAFDQVFLNPQGRSDPAGDAKELLAQLNSNPNLDFTEAGDRTLLPAELPLTSTAGINAMLGNEFTGSLASAPTGLWSGPIASSYGQHLVRVTKREGGEAPVFAEVRDMVARDWVLSKREEIRNQRFNEYFKKYNVKIDVSGAPPSP